MAEFNERGEAWCKYHQGEGAWLDKAKMKAGRCYAGGLKPICAACYKDRYENEQALAQKRARNKIRYAEDAAYRARVLRLMGQRRLKRLSQLRGRRRTMRYALGIVHEMRGPWKCGVVVEGELISAYRKTSSRRHRGLRPLAVGDIARVRMKPGGWKRRVSATARFCADYDLREGRAATDAYFDWLARQGYASPEAVLDFSLAFARMTAPVQQPERRCLQLAARERIKEKQNEKSIDLRIGGFGAMRDGSGSARRADSLPGRICQGGGSSARRAVSNPGQH